MTEKDYSLNLATAKRLVRKFGRSIELRKLASASPSPAEPWLGVADPVASGTSVTLFAVPVPPSSASSLGFSASQQDLMKNLSQIFIAEVGETDPENLNEYHTVFDGGTEYKIEFVEKLKPANLTLLYFIGVAR